MSNSPLSFFGVLTLLCVGTVVFFVLAGTMSAAWELFVSSFRQKTLMTRLAILTVSITLVSLVGCAYLN